VTKSIHQQLHCFAIRGRSTNFIEGRGTSLDLYPSIFKKYVDKIVEGGEMHKISNGKVWMIANEHLPFPHLFI
jgi:hypothetical protein